MDLHGHAFYMGDIDIKTSLLERRERLRSYGADHLELVSMERDCRHCGRRLGLGLDANDNPVLKTQGPSLDEFHRSLKEDYPVDTPCPFADVQTITVPFTCRSGRIALGNDFRRHFEKRPNFDLHFEVNCRAGKVAWIQHMATFGYLLGFVGNTSVHFVPREGGLDVVHLFEPEGTYSEKYGYRPSRSKIARKIRADEKASVHRVSTELWWFAIVDAADLPEGATDSYGRKIGYMDLPPGEYEMTYHFATQEQGPDLVTWAEIRRK